MGAPRTDIGAEIWELLDASRSKSDSCRLDIVDCINKSEAQIHAFDTAEDAMEELKNLLLACYVFLSLNGNEVGAQWLLRTIDIIGIDNEFIMSIGNFVQ